MSVAFKEEVVYGNLEELMKALGLTEDTLGRPLMARDLLDVMAGHEGDGYGICTPEELGQLTNCAHSYRDYMNTRLRRDCNNCWSNIVTLTNG